VDFAAGSRIASRSRSAENASVLSDARATRQSLPMIDHGLVIRHRLSIGRVGVTPAQAAGDRVFVDVETTVEFLRRA
jgi:hypothetical protein